MNFYEITVPTFLRYLNQLDGLLMKVELQSIDMLSMRLHEDMLPLSQQVNAAVGFTVRTCFPLMKRETPEISYNDASVNVLRENLLQVTEILRGLDPQDFIVREQEDIDIGAGFANFSLKPIPFIMQYALPNFFFHLSMAYGIMRANHIVIGKQDFDGFTTFPEGFKF